jgi:hypothetical protein
MPDQQRSGNLIISVSTSSLYTKVLFTATTGTVISLGPKDQPFNLTSSDPYLFEIWNDFSGDIPYIYVKKLTEEIAEAVYSNSEVSSDTFIGNNAFFNPITVRVFCVIHFIFWSDYGADCCAYQIKCRTTRPN